MNYLSKGINIFAGVRQNLGLKALTPNKKDVRFTFHTRRAVQSAIADLLVFIWEEVKLCKLLLSIHFND